MAIGRFATAVPVAMVVALAEETTGTPWNGAPASALDAPPRRSATATATASAARFARWSIERASGGGGAGDGDGDDDDAPRDAPGDASVVARAARRTLALDARGRS
jgi:hypothetical protein